MYIRQVYKQLLIAKMNTRPDFLNNASDNSQDNQYLPEFFKLHRPDDFSRLSYLLQSNDIQIFDTIASQLGELLKSRTPHVTLSRSEWMSRAEDILSNTGSDYYGVWVYYPWSRKLVHLLDKKEFIELRTNRNHYKITLAEQELLSTKKVGIVGLSVGQSVALTIAMERSAGEIRLADFDELDLSNFNRIRTPLYNMGLKKVYAVAREIAEIDPYITVRCFPDGLTEENMSDFLEHSGTLDLMIDECDGLDMKIILREECSKRRIPVLMETSDRGMVDIERFDIEPDRPLMHGLVSGLKSSMIKGLSNEDKIPYMLPMIGVESISKRLKASMMEVGQTLSTWPQLASAVIMGGGICGDTARRILLGQLAVSGRFYIDPESIINDGENGKQIQDSSHHPVPFSEDQLKSAVSNHRYVPLSTAVDPDSDTLRKLIKAAASAPSGGNNQPWMWVWHKSALFLFHDISKSHSLLDYKNLASYLALGAACENLRLASGKSGYSIDIQLSDSFESSKPIAVIQFVESLESADFSLANQIFERLTNRMLIDPQPIPTDKKIQLQDVLKDQNLSNLHFYESEGEIEELANIIAAVERIRFLNKRGHSDFVNEMRWTREENEQKRDGVDLETLDMKSSEKIALKMATDPDAIGLLREWNKGKGFEKISRKPVEKSSGLVLITMKSDTQQSFFYTGMVMERVWLKATEIGISLHPVSPSTFLMMRVKDNELQEFTEDAKEELKELNKRFNKVLHLPSDEMPVFLMRMFIGDLPKVKSLRKIVKDILYII